MPKIEFVEYYESKPPKQLELVAPPDPDVMPNIPHDDSLGSMDVTFECAKDIAKAMAIHVKDGRKLVVKVPNKDTGEMDWKFWVMGKKSEQPNVAESVAKTPTPVETGAPASIKRVGREN